MCVIGVWGVCAMVGIECAVGVWEWCGMVRVHVW
jgi:hypothetical protein